MSNLNCNPDPNQRTVLTQLNSFAIHDINGLLKQGITLSCMIKYDIAPEKLNKLDVALLKEKITNEAIDEQTLREAGMSESLLSEFFAPVIPEPPQPPFGYPSVSLPSNPIIQDIIDRKRNVHFVQDDLIEGKISEMSLRHECFLDDQTIERIRNYSMEQMDAVDLDNLPPLKSNRTDFYFLGLAGAGKSCLLASLLSYWYTNGIANIQVDNTRGVRYMRILGGGFAEGKLPIGNPNAFIDYIDMSLRVEEKSRNFFGRESIRDYDIPINLIDMAGEKFAKVADEGREAFDRHMHYFNNNNLKALFFVIDYTNDKKMNNAFNQGFSLQVVLRNMDNMGILEDTTGIYVVVTKADQFGVGFDEYASFAENYVKENYSAFYNTIKELESKYDFGVEVLPYSIGDCMFGQLITDFNPQTNRHLKHFPEMMHQKVIKHTARFRRGAGGIFTN